MGSATLRWVESTLMVETGSNRHSIVIGRAADDATKFNGIKPSDLLLLAVASCSAYDVVEILAKQKQTLRDLNVTCRGKQESLPPYNFTDEYFVTFVFINTF